MRAILANATVFFALLFLVRAIVFTAIELARPARRIDYGAVMWSDLAAYAAYAFLIVPGAAFLSNFFPGHHTLPSGVARWPLPLRLGLYFVIADFGQYWVHRVLHTQALWQMHKWHHSPTYMYWLSGVRSTLPQQFLSNIPYFLAAPFLEISPWWTGITVGAIALVYNDWMHMNVSWRSRWLELFIVTPRYHRLHHSDNPKHYIANLAAHFTIWDRLFGTYVDPDTEGDDLPLGVGEIGNPIRLVVGL